MKLVLFTHGNERPGANDEDDDEEEDEAEGSKGNSNPSIRATTELGFMLQRELHGLIFPEGGRSVTTTGRSNYYVFHSFRHEGAVPLLFASTCCSPRVPSVLDIGSLQW